MFLYFSTQLSQASPTVSIQECDAREALTILEGVAHEMLLLRLEAASHFFMPPAAPVSSFLSHDTTFPSITHPFCGAGKALF